MSGIEIFEKIFANTNKYNYIKCFGKGDLDKALSSFAIRIPSKIDDMSCTPECPYCENETVHTCTLPFHKEKKFGSIKKKYLEV